ncbi:MAG TPA: TetR/AcrR family transcriptional regulator [Nocardioides sp.]
MSEQPEPSRADATRARLMAAAVDAFAARGFHGTTTRDIATAAGMSPAALYVHHRSKAALLHLISRAGPEATLELVLAARASSDDPAEQLRRVMHDFAEHHAEGHTAARVVNYELTALSPEHHAEIMDLRRRIDAEMQDLVEAGVAAGVFDVPDPRIASAALLSLGIDIARWYDDRAGWSPRLVAEHYAAIALRIVGAG